MRAIWIFILDYWRMMRGRPLSGECEDVERMWNDATKRAADRQGKS